MSFLDLFLDLVPSPFHLSGSTQQGPRLAMVRRKTEAQPRARIALGRPPSFPDQRENIVVRLSVSTKVLLDAGEPGINDALASKHQSLKATRHSTVSVREGMDHDKIQMTHGGSHDEGVGLLPI